MAGFPRTPVKQAFAPALSTRQIGRIPRSPRARSRGQFHPIGPAREVYTWLLAPLLRDGHAVGSGHHMLLFQSHKFHRDLLGALAMAKASL